jgi:PHD/YefM family antitoxin component YafN of YafNO toxin-antitoxin module
METITSAQFQRKIRHYLSLALIDPVMVTRNDRERVVLLSADEFYRLKRRDRVVLRVEDLTDADAAAIATAEVPAEYTHLDAEL